jgi:hypothetical protein
MFNFSSIWSSIQAWYAAQKKKARFFALSQEAAYLEWEIKVDTAALEKAQALADAYTVTDAIEPAVLNAIQSRLTGNQTKLVAVNAELATLSA